jgi:hypothetical protein
VIRTLAARPPITRIIVIAMLALGLSGLAIAMAPSAHTHDSVSAAASPATRAALREAMRELWEDHIVWTRMVIIGATDDLEDFPFAVERLLSNQDEIGDAIKPFYGDAAGEELSRLLREHIVVAADILTAAKAGDSDAVATASTAWYVNGDEIAAFLAQANPRNWPLDEMRTMMRDHLDLTLAEALARLNHRYADDIVAYDQIHAQILHMADMLSDGIIAQFPAKVAR